MSPDARLIAPENCVPVGWVRDTLDRLGRWTEPDANLSDADKLSTIAAVLVNVRAELRQFSEDA